MREIKFRAWDLRNSKWFHQELFVMTHRGFYPNSREFDGGQSLWDHEFELMQYTGLTDKNGVEVYEGDIIKLTYSGGRLFVGEVLWEEGAYFVRKFGEYAFLVSQYERGEIEVIGNVYEHPHLLEGDSK